MNRVEFSLIAIALLALAGCQGSLGANGGHHVHVHAVPPANVREVVQRLISHKGAKEFVARAEIAAPDLKTLDAYARENVGGKDCQVNAIYGCGSCCNGDYYSNLVDTTCGWQCWVCGGPECNKHRE